MDIKFIARRVVEATKSITNAYGATYNDAVELYREDLRYLRLANLPKDLIRREAERISENGCL